MPIGSEYHPPTQRSQLALDVRSTRPCAVPAFTRAPGCRPMAHCTCASASPTPPAYGPFGTGHDGPFGTCTPPYLLPAALALPRSQATELPRPFDGPFLRMPLGAPPVYHPLKAFLIKCGPSCGAAGVVMLLYRPAECAIGAALLFHRPPKTHLHSVASPPAGCITVRT